MAVDPVAGPVLGPCSSWIEGVDVAACCPVSASSDAAELDAVALEASMLLFEVSGRQFSGLCDRTVRPCRDGCSCFGRSVAAGLGPWYWTSYGTGNWWWRTECGDRCGCGTLPRIRLAGYPVREIAEVKIDGAVVDPSEYRLDGWRWLVRMSDPGPPVVARTWPACQNLTLDDDQPGTYSVAYRHGVEPPELGRQAAAQLACQLWLACNGEECQLPSGVTEVVRQGIRVQRGLLVDWFSGGTGLVLVDAFLRAYGWKGRRRPAVWSPDLQPFARRVGTA